MCRPGSANPKWRGGVSSVKTADDLLDLDKQVRDRLLKYLTDNCVLKGECWVWTGSLFNKRYARFLRAGLNGLLGHKVSFVLHTSTKTGKGYVCHTCDNMRCVNPKHLYLGTAKSNSQDMVSRGRCRDQDGEKNNMAVLTEKKVLAILDDLRAGKKQNATAIKFKVSKQTINLIAHGKIWKTLTASFRWIRKTRV